MTASMPDYSIESEAGGRAGRVIGETAAHEERKVRASDSRGHSTDKLPDEHRQATKIWLWALSLLSLFSVILLGVLIYRLFG
jgi:hypothetical protein